MFSQPARCFMQLRHRTPTIFSIYMLDVVCCALGCVVLLWQVSTQQVESASNDVSQLQALFDALTKKHQAAEQELDQARKTITLNTNQLRQLKIMPAMAQPDYKDVSAKLTGEAKINAHLLFQLALHKEDLTKIQAKLDTLKKKSQEEVEQLTISKTTALELLKKLEQAKKELEQTNKSLTIDVNLTKAELDRFRAANKKLVSGANDLEAAKKLIAALIAERDALETKWLASDKKLSGAAGTIDSLNLEKNKLNQRIVALQTEADQRFAGIPLTGENVVFLIDVSGSMTKKDSKTDDPDKWPFLCETLMKLMRSIPGLRRFQVILFSDNTHYLFGNKDYWLKYNGPETAKITCDALKKFKVGGGTNMQEGSEEAFR